MRVDLIRARVLRFFNADPEQFDLVFVANTTAAVTLVVRLFRDHWAAPASGNKLRHDRFWYGYHYESDNELLRIPDLTGSQFRCFASDEDVEAWIRRPTGK